jgi:hypothetical protein
MWECWHIQKQKQYMVVYWIGHYLECVYSKVRNFLLSPFLKWGSHGYDDLFKSILVDAHAANIHSKFAFMWFLMFPEKNHIKTLLSHISIILTPNFELYTWITLCNKQRDCFPPWRRCTLHRGQTPQQRNYATFLCHGIPSGSK